MVSSLGRTSRLTTSWRSVNIMSLSKQSTGRKKCFLTRENIVANNLQEVFHHNVIEYVEYR
jgi:hypothetical protein